MKIVDVDCSGVRTEAAFWQRYVDVLRPEAADTFGRNLDALWEAIEDGAGPGHPGHVVVRFINTTDLRRPENATFVAALTKLADATSGRVIVR